MPPFSTVGGSYCDICLQIGKPRKIGMTGMTRGMGSHVSLQFIPLIIARLSGDITHSSLSLLPHSGQ